MTTLLHVTSDSSSSDVVDNKVSRQFCVSTPIIKNSVYFSDLINYTSHDSILFPSQYNDAVDVYLNYAQELQCVLHTQLQIKMAFELCHYLDDSKFLMFLTNYLLVNMWKHIVTSDNNINMDLHPNIKRDIYLHIPLCFVPTCISEDELFIRDWIIINKDKNYVIHDFEYTTSIKYYDDNKDIKELECLRRRHVEDYHTEDCHAKDCHAEDYHTEDYHRHGIYKFWCPLTSGKKFLLREMNYENGNYHGCVISWYSNDKILNLSQYWGGKQHGCDILWCSNGSLLWVIQYEMGVESGIYNKYYQGRGVGIQVQQGHYSYGKRDGDWRLWYRSGNIRYETTFNNDVRIGCYKEYYDTSQHHIMKQYHFDQHGKETGTFRMWWPPTSILTSTQQDKQHIQQTHKCGQLKYEYRFGDQTSKTSKFKYTEWDQNGVRTYNINNNNILSSQLKHLTFKSTIVGDVNVNYKFY